jgi:ATP-dependent DNA ligase
MAAHLNQSAPNGSVTHMPLPVPVELAAMEALSVAAIPDGDGWQYEPKWDGFRCLAFRDDAAVELRSKSGRSLTRYFPDVVAALRGVRARRFALDGEIVIPEDDALSFDALLQRIHPAESRVRKLAAETPAWLIVFDLLAEGARSLVSLPLHERRARLDAFAAKNFASGGPLRLSPATTRRSEAETWYAGLGASVDGVIAKRLDAPYAAGERGAMQKIKRLRTADCVVGGFRYAERARVVGSLLLGLYDDDGLLHHVGFCSGLKAAERPALTKKLEALIAPPGFTGRAPGGPSRWSTKRSAEWQPLKPKLVVEVRFDHVSGGRFRHGTSLLRWRPDKAPRQCTMEQLEQKSSGALALLAGHAT